MMHICNLSHSTCGIPLFFAAVDAAEPDVFNINSPFSSRGIRAHPVLKRFLLASKRGKGCASVFSTI